MSIAKLHRIFYGLVITAVSLHVFAQEESSTPHFLPEQFHVYFKEDEGVANQPFTGAKELILPTNNSFKGTPGCYVACYSHNKAQSIYPVAKDIFVMGQFRIEGSYEQRFCLPKGYEEKDISAENHFKQECEKFFPSQCKNLSCWVGGDTGGWLDQL
jgi:hypothetical protein